MTSNIRRHCPRVAISAIVIIAAVMAVSAQPGGSTAPVDEILKAGNFKVEIHGIDLSSTDTVSAEVDPIEIEMHDVTESNDPTWKQFTNGAVRYGEARFTFRVAGGNFNKDLSEWVQGGSERERKTISVVILDKKGRLGRRYTLVDCLPVGFAPAGGIHLVNRVCPRCPQSDNLAELTVQIGSIKIDGGSQADPPGRDPGAGGGSATNADQIVRYKGFDVEIRNVDEVSGNIDSSWGEVRGGAVGTEMVEATGKQYVSDITMTGYMTPARRALIQWMNNSIARDSDNKIGRDVRADVTITPKIIDGTRGPSHSYTDSMITRIEIPRLTAGSAEPIEEKVTLRPMRRDDPN